MNLTMMIMITFTLNLLVGLMRYLIGMMEHFNDSADKLCQQLFKKADGQTEVLMAEEFYDVTLDVIAKVLILHINIMYHNEVIIKLNRR